MSIVNCGSYINLIDRMHRFLFQQTQIVSPEEWEVCANFFNHPTNQDGAKYCVSIPGLKAKALPIQAVIILRGLLKMAGTVRHVIHGHEMGFGKTKLTYMSNHIMHLICRIQEAVRKNPEQHLDADAPALAPCLRNKQIRMRFGFDCTCSKQSPFHRAQFTLGVNLILASVSLQTTWVEEWYSCYGDPRQSDDDNYSDTNTFKMRLFHCHGDANERDKLEFTRFRKDIEDIKNILDYKGWETG